MRREEVLDKGSRMFSCKVQYVSFPLLKNMLLGPLVSKADTPTEFTYNVHSDKMKVNVGMTTGCTLISVTLEHLYK